MSRAVTRHEEKFLVSTALAELLKSRFRAVLRPDEHALADGSYLIRSVYFDDTRFTAYNEKLAGVKERVKYRLRFYNFDDSVLFLEKKSKDGRYTGKDSVPVSRAEAESLLAGTDLDWTAGGGLLEEFALLRRGTHRGVAIVDYDRFAFTYPAENTRVTLDMDVRTCPYCTELFSPALPMLPVLQEGTCVLEVKYDAFLPSHIAYILEGFPKQHCAVSKYVQCLGVLE